jgi:hypothetical protein
MRAGGRTWRLSTITYGDAVSTQSWVLVSELARRAPWAIPVLRRTVPRSKSTASHWHGEVGTHTTGNHPNASEAAIALKRFLHGFMADHRVAPDSVEALAFSMLTPSKPQVSTRKRR